MGVIDTIRQKPAVGASVAGGLLLVALIILAYTQWPARQAKLDAAFFSDDDGKTWFSDSMYQAAPLQRNGKEAVQAQIYSYANGSKQFCAYLSKLTPEAKQKLDAAYAATRSAGKPLGTTALLADRRYMTANTLVKKPGDAAWLPLSDPKANLVMAPRSPDGSEVDQVMVY